MVSQILKFLVGEQSRKDSSTFFLREIGKRSSEGFVLRILLEFQQKTEEMDFRVRNFGSENLVVFRKPGSISRNLKAIPNILRLRVRMNRIQRKMRISIGFLRVR